MADKIVVLNAGRVEQIGSPLELYNAPVNRFVAGFIGSPRMNFLSIHGQHIDSGRVKVNGGFVSLPPCHPKHPARSACARSIWNSARPAAPMPWTARSP